MAFDSRRRYYSILRIRAENLNVAHAPSFQYLARPPKSRKPRWAVRSGKRVPLRGRRWGRRIPLDVLERNISSIKGLQRKFLNEPLRLVVLCWAHRGVVYLVRVCFSGPNQVGERPAERCEARSWDHRCVTVRGLVALSDHDRRIYVEGVRYNDSCGN